MLPTLKNGEIVIYNLINPEEFIFSNGQIVVFKNPLEDSKLLIKRIYKVTSYGLDVRGDNEEESIDSRQFGIVRSFSVLGVVEKVIKDPFV